MLSLWRAICPAKRKGFYMHLSTGGYSSRQYDSNRLRRTAQHLATELPRIMAETGADTIAVTGKSGLSLAFATLMLIDFPLTVVRKRNEMSHGNQIEGKDSHRVRHYLILDDFVDSGATVRNIVSIVEERAEFSGCATPECVGVVTYAGSERRPVVIEGDRHVQIIPCYTAS